VGVNAEQSSALCCLLLLACWAFRCSPHGGAEAGVHSHELEPGPLSLAQLLQRELTLFVDVVLAGTTAGPVVLPHVRTPAPIRLPALAPQWSDFLGQVHRAHCTRPPQVEGPTSGPRTTARTRKASHGLWSLSGHCFRRAGGSGRLQRASRCPVSRTTRAPCRSMIRAVGQRAIAAR